jgi:hypothetical protein
MANSTTPRRTPAAQPRRTGQPRKATNSPRTGFTPRPITTRRAQPQKGKAAGLLSAVTSALPSGGQAKAKAKTTKAKAKAKTPNVTAKRPPALALLAGAGGLAAALSQRNKLKGMVGKGGASEDTVTTPVATASPTSAVTAVDPITNGPAGTQPGQSAI